MEDNAELTWGLMRIIMAHPGWDRLDDLKRHVTHMTMHKVARYLSGDPEYDDNWVDIVGYNQYVVNALREAEGKRAAAPDLSLTQVNHKELYQPGWARARDEELDESAALVRDGTAEKPEQHRWLMVALGDTRLFIIDRNAYGWDCGLPRVPSSATHKEWMDLPRHYQALYEPRFELSDGGACDGRRNLKAKYVEHWGK
jgi:hypothetical protein